MTQILVDSRESRSRMTQLLQDLGVRTVQQELESADYVLAEGMGVERKTAVDFIASILDGRLFVQAKLLKSCYTRPFILIEGDLFDTPSGIEPAALVGAVSALSVIEGIQVLSTRDVHHSAQLMATMHRHATEGLGYEIALRAGKPRDRALQAQYLLEGLPGVGPAGARRLLEHLGSPQAVFAAPAQLLQTVPGVGPKSATTIRQVLEWSATAVRPSSRP